MQNLNPTPSVYLKIYTQKMFIYNKILELRIKNMNKCKSEGECI